MKLFSKEIDKKLFSQYSKGSDLDNQVVVTKIFNPYGNGRWFLLNSDPQHPDYLWAIVQMGDVVEMGSVPRSELESVRVSPFRLPLERDLSFRMVNAGELFRGLQEGKFYKKGGFINGYAKGGLNENKDKGKNAQEIWDNLNFTTRAKVLKHLYMGEDGDNAQIYEYYNSINELSYSDWDKLPKNIKNKIENFTKVGNMAKGGHTNDLDIDSLVGKKLDDGKIIRVEDLSNNNVWVVRENFSGLVIEQGFTKDDIIKLLKGEKVEGLQMMAKGGGIYTTDSLYYLQVIKDDKEVAREKFRAKSLKEAKEISEEEYESNYISKYGNPLNFIVSEAMEEGGKTIDSIRKEIDERNMKIRFKIATIIGLDKAIKYLDMDYVISPFKLIEASVSKGFITIDEIDENIWRAARIEADEINDYYRGSGEGIGSSDINAFVSNMLNEAGIKVSVVDGRYTRMSEGGEVDSEGKRLADNPNWTNEKLKVEYDSLKKDLQNFNNGLLKPSKVIGTGYKSSAIAKRLAKEWLEKNVAQYKKALEIRGVMAMGGKVKFADKVKEVKASLLKRKKVSPSVQKDYGKTYSPKEAEESAKRIIGAQVKKYEVKKKFKKGGKTIAQTPAPSKDRVYGSSKNKVGSASSQKSAMSIKLDEDIVKTLTNKAKEYNENHSSKVSTSTLKAVMRRGMGAYSTSHRPTISGGAPNSRQAWGFARVNKFLLKKGGTKVKKAYVQDDDLLKNGGELKNKMKVSDKPKFKRLIDLEERAKDSMYKPSNVNNYSKWNETTGARFSNKWNKMVLELRGYNDSEGKGKGSAKPEWIKFVEEQGRVEDYNFGDVLA